MFNVVKKALLKKHALIIGESHSARKKFINGLISNMNFETFRFPENMKSIQQYIDFIKREGLFSPFYESNAYNDNQILDFHWDWISENSSLIVLEEFGQMDPRWKMELLNTYLNELESRKKGKKKIHVIFSQPKEDGLIEELSNFFEPKKNDKRTKRQIVEQNLCVFNLESTTNH